MKRVLVVLTILTIAAASVAAADAPDPIADAMAHARVDASRHTATGWGAMAFGASVILGPLLGGGAVIIAANVVEPSVELPTMRLAEAQKAYPDNSQMLLYQAQYQESMVQPIQKDRSRRAWIGTGLGFGLNLVLVSLILSVY